MRAVFQSLKANGAPRWSEGDFPPRPTKKKEETTLETLGKLAALGESVAFKVDCVPKRNETKKNERKKEKKKSGRGGVGGGHGRVVAQVRSVNGRVHLRPGVDTKGRYLSGRVGSGFVSFAFFLLRRPLCGRARPATRKTNGGRRW